MDIIGKCLLLILLIIVIFIFHLDYKLINCGINPISFSVNKKYHLTISTEDFNEIENDLKVLLTDFNSKNEINELININNSMNQERRSYIAKKYDSIYSNYKQYIPNKTEFNAILEEINCIIIKLKFIFRRKRPLVYSNKIQPIFLMSGQTPTFPSGHATQYWYIYLYIKDNKDLSPTELADVKKIAEDGAYSRLVANIHFPIDNKAGVLVAEKVYNILHS